jgi:hypothetical protein
MPYNSDSIERMIEIKDQIKELVNEAQDILERGTITYNRARSYWIPHILMELDKDHDWLGGSMCTMQNTIDEMEIDLENNQEDIELTEVELNEIDDSEMTL